MAKLKLCRRALNSARAMTTSRRVTAAEGRGANRFDRKHCALHHARSAKQCSYFKPKGFLHTVGETLISPCKKKLLLFNQKI